MEGASNGGMLYHEVQESKLCAVHCVNTVLQGPFFSEFDLAALASDLDRKERQMMIQGGGGGGATSGDFLSEESHNVSLDGDFSIQVRFFYPIHHSLFSLFVSRESWVECERMSIKLGFFEHCCKTQFLNLLAEWERKQNETKRESNLCVLYLALES